MSAVAESGELAPAWTERDLDRLRELVRAEESSAWEIGDQLLRLLPVGRVGVKTGVAATIRQLAAKVDAEPEALSRCRKVAYGWPKGARVPFATWAAHRAYMGPPDNALARSKTISGLPRNEHGKVTVQAVKALTKAGGRGKPGWHELLGRVGDALITAQKALAVFDGATEGREVNDKLRAKAVEYADHAEQLADRLRAIASDVA